MRSKIQILAISVAVLSLTMNVATADEVMDTPTGNYALTDTGTRINNLNTGSRNTNFSGNTFSNMVAGLGSSASSTLNSVVSSRGVSLGPRLAQYNQSVTASLQSTTAAASNGGLGALSSFLSDPRGAIEKWARDKANAELKKMTDQVGAKIDQATGEIRNAAGEVMGKINQATGEVRNAAGDVVGFMNQSGQIKNAQGQIVGAVNSATGQVTSAAQQMGNNLLSSGNVTSGLTGASANIAAQSGNSSNPFVKNNTYAPQVLPAETGSSYQATSGNSTTVASVTSHYTKGGIDAPQVLPGISDTGYQKVSYTNTTGSSTAGSNPFVSAVDAK